MLDQYDIMFGLVHFLLPTAVNIRIYHQSNGFKNRFLFSVILIMGGRESCLHDNNSYLKGVLLMKKKNLRRFMIKLMTVLSLLEKDMM